jgi:hypothetical protein
VEELRCVFRLYKCSGGGARPSFGGRGRPRRREVVATEVNRELTEEGFSSAKPYPWPMEVIRRKS